MAGSFQEIGFRDIYEEMFSLIRETASMFGHELVMSRIDKIIKSVNLTFFFNVAGQEENIKAF